MSRLILNRYQPVDPKGKTAGEGVSGIVVKARDTQGQYGAVAVKRPNPMLSPVDSRKKSAQIKREGEALKRLSHPSACRYVEEQDVRSSNSYILVMEWAEGTQLEQRLRELERSGETFPLGEALEILDQLAGLLAHAHQQEVIHNDIDAKHLFWHEAERHLTVIDWANCGLGSDAKKIATEADDIKQYGELMHRLLTGSTLDIATRLGKESGWRIELEDRKIPATLQNIVARAVGRDSQPYRQMAELAAELHQFKLRESRPFSDKVILVDRLLSQEQHTYETLAQAKELIREVAAWDPTLIRNEQDRLERIELERAQNLAIVRAKVSIRNEEWSAALQRIVSVCGPDPEHMPVEARLIYWLSSLLDKTDSQTAPYELRKQAAGALLLQDTPDPESALNYILLSYGVDQPEYEPLLAELARQTEQPYPPLRSRLPQMEQQVQPLLELNVAEQLGHYQGLLQRIKNGPASARQLLETLLATLQDAHQAAEMAHSYQRASDQFYRAFHIDPHNYRLYWLAELMGDLSRAARENPDNWPQACEELASRAEYGFAAALAYLHHAKSKYDQFVRRNIDYIRQFRLDTAWTDLETIRQEHAMSPSLQSVWSICASYRYLYGYAEGSEDGIQQRLERAADAWEQAQGDNLQDSPDELAAELKILTALINGYGNLYEAGLLQLDSVQAELAGLPQPENHRLIRQVLLELDRLAQWKGRYETLLRDCLQHRFAQAHAYAQRYQEADKDRDAFFWLAPALRPNWPNWQRFCESAHQGQAAWQNRQFQAASEQFSAAEAQLPAYIDGQPPQKLQADLQVLASSLRALQTSLAQGQKLLAGAGDFETYRHLPGLLDQARQNESRVINILGGKAYLAASAELANLFVRHARVGQLEALQGLLSQKKFAHDPLLEGYRRVVAVITRAQEPDVSLPEIEHALRLAPESRILQQRKIDIEKFEQALGEIIKAIRWADIGAAQNRLRTLKSELSTLPKNLDGLEALLLAYSYLIGDTRGNQRRSTKDRISYASQSLNEAHRILQQTDRAELSEEVEMLSRLVPIFRDINQFGLDYIETARAEIGELQTRRSIVETHEVISRLAADLAGLEKWKQRRKALLDDLLQYDYTAALKRLQRLTDPEKSGLKWLNEVHQPDVVIWEKFCSDGQHMLALWQAHQYGRAAEALAALTSEPPADLTPVMASQLTAQYQATAADLRAMQAGLNDSAAVLAGAVDASGYDEVDKRLLQAKSLEANYSPQLIGGPFIAALHDRFYNFSRLARHGDTVELEALVAEANQAGDPLTPAYERISAVIEQGLSPSADPDRVEAARKLAPDSYLGGAAAGPVNPEQGGAYNILAHIRRGDLETARQLLREAPDNAATSCLWHTCSGYHHLYGQVVEDRTIKDRISKARQALAEAQSVKVEEPGLKQQLEQEVGTLEALIWAYNEIHTTKLSNLQTVRENGHVRTLMTTQPEHAFVQRLAEELEALERLKTRWQRVSYYWGQNQYRRAWQEIKEITRPETNALGWLWDELQLNWQKWQDFIRAQAVLKGRAKLVAGLAVLALGLVVCYAGIVFGLVRPITGLTGAAGSLAAPELRATPTIMPVVGAVPTATPEEAPAVPSPTPAPTVTLTPEPAATDTSVPEPTATPPLLIGDSDRGAATNVLALEKWVDLALISADTPNKVYVTPPSFWHIVTGTDPHIFWVDQMFQEFPFEFRISLNTVERDTSYGIGVLEQSSGQIYSMALSPDEAGQVQYRIIVGDEVVGNGQLTSSDLAQSSRPFSISIKIIDNLMAFIVNDEEQVYVYQAPEAFAPGWQPGVYAGPNAHAIVSSAYIYQLNPGE